MECRVISTCGRLAIACALLWTHYGPYSHDSVKETQSYFSLTMKAKYTIDSYSYYESVCVRTWCSKGIYTRNHSSFQQFSSAALTSQLVSYCTVFFLSLCYLRKMLVKYGSVTMYYCLFFQDNNMFGNNIIVILQKK